MSMANPGGGNTRPDRCPSCGGVAPTEVGMAFVAGDPAIRWEYECGKCGEHFLWPPSAE